MAKEKTCERNLENITLKKLKFIIILCFVLCIICEFVPDILHACKWFDRYSFFAFLQHHKDFFTNVSLGCLGSAVISYFMLQIQIETIEKEKKENLKIILKKVVSKYWYLNFAITNSYDVKNQNKDLQIAVEEFINYYDESGLSNKCYEDYIEIFKSKLIPIVNEVEIFLNSFNLMVKKEELIQLYNHQVYNKVVKEIYNSFYITLLEEFQLQEINKKLAKVNFANDSLIEELEKILEMFHDSSNTRKYACSSLKYSNMMMELLSIENLEKLEDEVSK